MSVHISGKIFVSGDTYKQKDALKRLGGVWVKSLTGWLFDESKRDAVAALFPDVADGPAAAPLPPSPSVNANATLLVAKHKKAILVTGETKKVKEQLSALKGRWNGPLCGWIFPGGQRGAVLELLRKDSTNKVEVEDEEDEDEDQDAEKPPANKVKREAGEGEKPAKKAKWDDDDDE